MTDQIAWPDRLPIQPIGHPLHASVRVPGSKSITNRALLMAALADGTSNLEGVLFSDDSRHFMNALQTLGFNISIHEETCAVAVAGLGGKIPQADPAGTTLFVGNSGTTARFLASFLALGSGIYRIDGVERMRQRPIRDLMDAMQQLEVDVQDELGTGCPPIRIAARGLKGGKASIIGRNSSQFLSSLLMTAPYANNEMLIEVIDEPASIPYIDITLRMMNEFGVHVEKSADYKKYRIPAGQIYKSQPYLIEPDASNSSYFFAAAALLGGTVSVRGLHENSLQGDAQFPKVLAQMGCEVEYLDQEIRVTGPDWAKGQKLKGIDVDLNGMPDMVQTLAVIAPFADGPVRVRNVENLRIKETDRISAVVTELRKLGVQTDEYDDGLAIYPIDRIKPAAIHTYDDHRMAMSFSLIGLREPGIVIEDPKCVNKTFPTYFDVQKGLY